MQNCTIESQISLHDSIISSNSKILNDNNNENRTYLLGEGTIIIIISLLTIRLCHTNQLYVRF